jgi:radical SAM superfamily enzyme
MPVYKCPNGKYKIGSGACIFNSESAANSALSAYYAKFGEKACGGNKKKAGK